MSYGYVYCFSNAAMPGILKVGMTLRTPEDRLAEANGNGTATFRPPCPYVIEFAKRVHEPKEKERVLHHILDKYTSRVNPRREFFRASVKQVRELFQLMDGKEWMKDDSKPDTCDNKGDESSDDELGRSA